MSGTIDYAWRLALLNICKGLYKGKVLQDERMDVREPELKKKQKPQWSPHHPTVARPAWTTFFA